MPPSRAVLSSSSPAAHPPLRRLPSPIASQSALHSVADRPPESQAPIRIAGRAPPPPALALPRPRRRRAPRRTSPSAIPGPRNPPCTPAVHPRRFGCRSRADRHRQQGGRRMAREMSWFSFRRFSGSSSSSSDPDDVRNNLEWLQARWRDDMAWLDVVEAKVTIDAQTEIAKKEVKDWVYSAEDVLDEWRFEQLRASVDPPPQPIFGRRFSSDPVADLLVDRSFWLRVNDLKQRREEIGEFNRMLRLGRAQGPPRHGRIVEPPPTSSLPGEQQMHGRDDDREMIVKFLLEGAMEERLSVIPIVGGAGVGKTTLVQHIYNETEVSEHFKLHGWVSALRCRQMMKLIKAVAESLAGGLRNYSQLGVVQHLLKRKIDGHRCLLVLDDVWYETIDGDQWEKLCNTFSGCANGSVIILTTQDERVADRTGTLPNYILESLSGDRCWSVFQKNAFGSLPTDDRLVAIGKKIAKECQGSPLVAKALGVRLRHDRDVERWEEFLQRDMWDEVVPELKLSYHRLPAHLKRCFVYCSMFPKGYLFNRDELVRLWMAHGFIEEKREKLLEDAGIKYFDDLSIMSFFQQSELDMGAFVMPHLLHALAQFISDGECITLENSNLCNIPRNDLQRARHLSSTPSNSELSTKFLSFATHLRSFLVVPTWPLKNIAHISLSDEAFHSLNRLRVLDIRHTDITALPNTIGNLKHLRYLNLSGTKIEKLHASVFQLYNLQTLDLSCTAIRELPRAIGNLNNLLHLRLNVTMITKIPESIGKLSKLQTLHLGVTKIEELPETIGSLKWLRFLCIDVSKIRRLPESICELSDLQTLELQGPDDEESISDAMFVDGYLEEQLNEENDQMKVKQDVSDMADSSTNSFYTSNDTIREGNVHEDLQSHTNLQMVDVRCYDDEKFLMWMESPSFSKLTHVVIKNCMKCKTLPQLGQLPLLKVLDIDGMSVEHVGKEFCGSGDKHGFRSLEKLSFENMSEWEEWDGVEKGDFPCLKELNFFNCPKLKKVPCLHYCLTKLNVERCAVDTIWVTKSLQELQLCACDNLSELRMCACDNLLELPALNSLCKLTLMYCENLTSLPPVCLPEKLWIEECEQLLQCELKIPILHEQLLYCNITLSDELKICILSPTTFLAS